MDEELKQSNLELGGEQMPENAGDINLETSKKLVMNDEWDEWDEKQWKVEPSFRFKPISFDLWWSTIKNWEEWSDGITTKVEFAWWSEHTSLYGYVRKDWNKYAKWFNEWMELFANENIHLWKNIDLNGKQFYWWNWAGRILTWPQVSVNKKLWKVELWGSVGAYAQYDVLPWQENQISWSWIVAVNISIEQKDWKKWSWDAFLNVGWVKDLSFEGASTYWEANINTPNLLKDPKIIWWLSGWIFARYGWDLKNIKLSCLWVWATISF